MKMPKTAPKLRQTIAFKDGFNIIETKLYSNSFQGKRGYRNTNQEDSIKAEDNTCFDDTMGC